MALLGCLQGVMQIVRQKDGNEQGTESMVVSESVNKGIVDLTYCFPKATFIGVAVLWITLPPIVNLALRGLLIL